MTKTQIKAIALNASRQLNAVAKDVNYQRSMKAGIDESMEYAELVKKRIDALAEYIRPTRLKAVHISPKQIVQMLDTEQQAMHHLSTLLDDITIGGKA